MQNLQPQKPRNKVDWKKYNDSLSRRAELFLDISVLKRWEKEIKKLNKKKSGRRFVYPDCFIKYLALLQTSFNCSFRFLESIISFLSKHISGLKKPDHAAIHRRISSMKLNLDNTIKNRKKLVVSIDSSGLKVHNRGEWIRHKHKVRRGYLKIHFAINPKTRQIIELETTKEEVHDNKKFRPLIRKLLKKFTLKKVLADAAYDDHRNFNLLDRNKIIPAIKLKKNCFPYKFFPKRDKKFRIRNKYAKLFQKKFNNWRRLLGYKKRWTSEIVFSSFKAKFGEYFRSKKMENIEKEILRKAYVHNLLMVDMHKA